MKFLVLIAIVLVVLYVIRSTNRRKSAQQAAQSAASPREPLAQDMVQCPVCSVHLPRGDAVAGARGLLYCSAEHRREAGG